MKQVNGPLCYLNLKHILEAGPKPSKNTVTTTTAYGKKIKVRQEFAFTTAIGRQASAADFHLYENKTLGSPILHLRLTQYIESYI